MFAQSKIADFFLRMGMGLVIGMVLALILGEFSFQFLNDKQTAMREPQTIELVIPYGTAQLIKDGQASPTIPTDMEFVVGDTLVVKNEDIVDHQVGPLWIPSKTSGVLSLDIANKFSYQCSFQPTRYLGLDVRERITTGTRIQGLLAIALPSGAILGVYSYLIPSRKKKSEAPPAE